MTFYALIHGDNDYALFHVAYILWLMYSVSHSRTGTSTRQASLALFKMTTREGDVPANLPGRSSTDDFRSLTQKAVPNSVTSVSNAICSLIDAWFDNFRKQFAGENSSSVEAAVKRAKRDRKDSHRGTYRIGL